jgi:hypothetical protein
MTLSAGHLETRFGEGKMAHETTRLGDYPRCMASENVASAEVQNAHGAVASVRDAPPPNEPAMLTVVLTT